MCAENYNAVTGEALDQPDTDGFYSWGALLPMLAIAEVSDVSAWSGWTIRNDGVELQLGPLNTPIGRATLSIGGGVLRLSQGARQVLASNVKGSLRQIVLRPGFTSLQLPAGSEKGAEIRLFGIDSRQMVLARQGSRDLAVKAESDGILLTLAPTGADPETLLVVTAPA